MYIYIYICIRTRTTGCQSQNADWLGWHYLSNAACLMRPRLFYECLVVSPYFAYFALLL